MQKCVGWRPACLQWPGVAAARADSLKELAQAWRVAFRRAGADDSSINSERGSNMPWLHCVSYFFGGAFIANAIPHFVSGTMGRPFQSPFATPHGEGLSTSTVNVLWGAFNIAVGYLLICQVGNFDLRDPVEAVVVGLGALLMAVMCARLFGRFHGGSSPGK
jgi:hypothetical protein